MAPLCLILDLGALADKEGRLSQTGAAVLGAAFRAEHGGSRRPAESSGLLTTLLVDPGGAGLDVARADLAAFGGVESAERGWPQAVGSPEAALRLCPPGPGRVALIDGGREGLGLETWRLGEEGLATPEDVERRLREALRLPVARPVSPDRRRGAVVAFADVGRDDLLRAAFRDPAVRWVGVGTATAVYVENTDVEDWLLDLPGAERVARAVAWPQLSVGPTREGEDALLVSGGQALRTNGGEGAPIGRR